MKTKLYLVIAAYIIFCCIGCSYDRSMDQPYNQQVLLVGDDPNDVYHAIFERVYDGDTFYVTIKDLPKVFGDNLPIRVNGIDTPEVRTTSAYEKMLGYKARDYVASRLNNAKVIKLIYVSRGKYFRLVVDVYVDGSSLANELIDLGLAVAYDGGTKTKDWSEDYIKACCLLEIKEQGNGLSN